MLHKSDTGALPSPLVGSKPNDKQRCFCCNLSNYTVRVIWFSVFFIIAVVVGVLTVYFTSPKTSGRQCKPIFQRMSKVIIGDDSNPHGIATGDFNHDNQLDIVIANTGTDNIIVLFGYSNGILGNRSILSTGAGSGPTSIAVGHINKDNHLDIIVTNFGMHNIGLFFGHGNGEFADQKSILRGPSRPWTLALADLDNDNNTDIAVINYATNDITILLGTGNDSFEEEILYTTGYDSQPYSIAIGDLNNDTFLDIAVVNYGTDNFNIFYGFGDGTFDKRITYLTGPGSNPTDILITDVNQDQRLDILVTNAGTNCLTIRFGYGNGSFSTPKVYSTGSNSRPSHIATGYFNEDQVLDLVVSHMGADSLGVFLGSGSGTFLTQSNFSTSANSEPIYITTSNRSTIFIANKGINNVMRLDSYANDVYMQLTRYTNSLCDALQNIAVKDLDGDHNLDIVMSVVDNIIIFFGDKNGTFTRQTIYPTGNDSTPMAILIEDLNNDRRPDIAVANYGASSIRIFLGYGNGSFYDRGAFRSDRYLGPISIAAGDFNGDLQVDLVVANRDNCSLIIYYGSGNGSFLSYIQYQVELYSYPRSVACGDFNNDNILDVVLTITHSGGIRIYFGKGDGTFKSQLTYVTGKNSYPYAIAVADLNNDKQLDIVLAEYGEDMVAVIFGYGNGSFAPQVRYPLGDGAGPKWVDIADVNADGRLDIIVAISGNVGVYFASDYGVFSRLVKYATSEEVIPNVALTGDFNHDNRLDIAVVLLQNKSLGILVANYSALFNSQQTYLTGSKPHPSWIVSVDLNNDTYLDIIIANTFDENFSVRWGCGNGTFISETIYSTGVGSRPIYITANLFNSDPLLDVGIIDSSNNVFYILLRNSNGNFTKQTYLIPEVQSQPCSMVVGSLNGDDWIDIVVANNGKDNIAVYLGYHYPAFQDMKMYSTGNLTEPASIDVGDFDEDGSLDFVVANNLADNIIIFTGDGLGNFSMLIKYSTGRLSSPTSVIVADLNNDRHLDIIVILSADFAIFFGYGNGTFRNMNRYVTGIGNQIKALATGDINNDNRLDIVTTNGDSDTISVFLGYGNGTFSEQMPYSTGSATSPKSIAIADFNNDKRLDVVVSLTDKINILIGYGNGTFSNLTIYSLGDSSTIQMLTVGDLNNDRQLDIAVINTDPDSIGVLFGYGNGSFSSEITYSPGDNAKPQSIVIADINNDKRADIIVTNGFSKQLGMFFGCANGSFTWQRLVKTGLASFPQALAINDLNKDGFIDVIVSDVFTSSIQVYITDSVKLFDTKTTYSTGMNSKPCSMVIAYLDNDTYSDIIVANNGSNTIGIFYGYGNGTFSSLVTYSTGTNSNASAVVAQDVNNDRLLDIVVVNSNTNNIGIFLAYAYRQFSNIMTYSTGTGSQPVSLVLNDFNNDYNRDVAVANFGSNNIMILNGFGNGSFVRDSTIPMNFQSRPKALATGDFDRNNWTDIAVANIGSGLIEILLKTC